MKSLSIRAPGSRSEAAIKAWATRRSPCYRATKSENTSKVALSEWCRENGWRVIFFEGVGGSTSRGLMRTIAA